MKFQVERQLLADAVSWVARGLPQRPPMPVLAGILLVVSFVVNLVGGDA